jgi:hypothetical protein
MRRIRPTIFRPAIVSHLAAAWLCLAAAWPAHAEPRYELGIGTAIRAARSSSVHALHDGTAVDFSLNGALRLVETAGVDIFVDATVESGTTAGTTFQRMRTETSTTLALVGAQARRHLIHGLSAHGRAALGIGRVGVTMRHASGAWPVADSGVAGSAYLGAGLDFLPLRPRRRPRWECAPRRTRRCDRPGSGRE